MPIDINGYASSVYPNRVLTPSDSPAKPLPVEGDRQQNQQQPRNQINRDAIERKVAARADSPAANLQRYREPDELPRKTQSAIDSYQSNSRTGSQDDSELVGVDIFV